MSQHSIYYFPYASLREKQLPLLKTAALYFDKLYVLDPVGASLGRIGVEEHVLPELATLRVLGLVEPINPAAVLASHGNKIVEGVQADCSDPFFLQLCAQSGRAQTWTLALEKVPAQPDWEEAMREILGSTLRDGVTEANGDTKVNRWGVKPYDEYRGEGERLREYRSGRRDATAPEQARQGQGDYRYADLPLPVGESIMLHHALLGGLLDRGATPLSDEPFHRDVLAWKLAQARASREVREYLADYDNARQMRANLLAATVLQKANLTLPILDPGVSMSAVLQLREDRADELARARDALGDLAQRIKGEAGTEEFWKEIDRETIPDVKAKLDACRTVRDDWITSPRGRAALGVAAVTASAAAVALDLAAAPLTPFALLKVGLGAIGALPGVAELRDKWREARRPGNGLAYLLRAVA